MAMSMRMRAYSESPKKPVEIPKQPFYDPQISFIAAALPAHQRMGVEARALAPPPTAASSPSPPPAWPWRPRSPTSRRASLFQYVSQ